MKYEHAVEIERLAADLYEKQLRFQNCCIRNTPADPEKAREAFIQLEMARTEMRIADARLRDAQAGAVS